MEWKTAAIVLVVVAGLAFAGLVLTYTGLVLGQSDEDKQAYVGSGFLSGPTPPILTFTDEKGAYVMPDSVVIDGHLQQSKNSIKLEDIRTGEHQVLVTLSGIVYMERFEFKNTSLSIPLEMPVTTVVFVASVFGGLQDVSVYSDGQFKCKTDLNGICNFPERAGLHTIKIEGEGFVKEEDRTISRDSNTLKFLIERNFHITAKVLGMDFENPIPGAVVSIDGEVKGTANASGEVFVGNVAEGIHTFTASYNGFSETAEIEIKNSGYITIRIFYMPQKVYLEI